MNTNDRLSPTLPVPEPREVIGLTASFSGLAAMLVLATLAPNPAAPVKARAESSIGAAAHVASIEVRRHAVGV